MAIFKVEGGRRLRGEITPQGAKNEALQILCATLLTQEKVYAPGGRRPCYAQWKRVRPCENCVARRALEEKSGKSKLEYLDKELYQVTASYVLVDGKPCVLEMTQKMDRSLIEAAQDLGANPFQVFMKTILPLSMPGVMSGIVMVFMPTVSTFAIAELLTMNNIKLFGTTVQENIYNGMWNYGAALSLIMLLLIGVTILFTNEEDSASNEGGGVI